MKSYTGKTHKIYQLEDTPNGQGGEGAVCAISNDPDRVAKLYHEHKNFRTENARKNRRRKSSPITHGNIPLSTHRQNRILTSKHAGKFLHMYARFTIHHARFAIVKKMHGFWEKVKGLFG